MAPAPGTRMPPAPAPLCTHMGHDELLEVAPGAGGILLSKAQMDLVLRCGLPVAQVPPQLCKTPTCQGTWGPHSPEQDLSPSLGDQGLAGLGPAEPCAQGGRRHLRCRNCCVSSSL